MHHSVQGAIVDKILLLNFLATLCQTTLALKQSFERQASLLCATIYANAKESRTIATLWDTLLPKLLSGQLSFN